MTIGNGLIAAFVCGIAMAASERDVPEGFVEFAENASAILQVLTFFVFGALIVATGFHHSIPPLVLFVVFALLVARPLAVMLSFVKTGIPRPQKLFMAWFGPKGVASMLFALFVLKSDVGDADLIFDIAAIAIIASIVAHGLTDTVGAQWLARRVGLDSVPAESQAHSAATRNVLSASLSVHGAWQSQSGERTPDQLCERHPRQLSVDALRAPHLRHARRSPHDSARPAKRHSPTGFESRAVRRVADTQREARPQTLRTRPPRLSDGSGRNRSEPLFDPLGRGDVLAHAQLLRLGAERQADQLRQVQDGEAEVAVDDLGRLGLLHVEVEVAERAGGDQAVGAGVERVADVGAGLAQRGLAVHRDHREAAALAGAVVLDDLAAERLDHLLQVDVAVGVLVVAEPLLGADHVAAVEGADPQAGERPRRPARRGLSRP